MYVPLKLRWVHWDTVLLIPLLGLADFIRYNMLMLPLLVITDCFVLLSVYVAYYSDICVGAIACRLEKEGGAIRVYIMTLGVLAPYRGLGIGENPPFLILFSVK